MTAPTMREVTTADLRPGDLLAVTRRTVTATPTPTDMRSIVGNHVLYLVPVDAGTMLAPGHSPWQVETAVAPSSHLDRAGAILEIRRGLRQRSGKAWSVSGGTGTAWGWITITAPPARRGPCDDMTDEDAAELAVLLGLRHVGKGGELVPSSSDYRAEYVDRAHGRTPTVVGSPYWD